MASPHDVRRIAVVLPDMIGTTVCAEPALSAIYRAWPEAAVTLLGFEPESCFLLDEPCGRDLTLAPLAELGAHVAARLREPPDLAFDFLGTAASRAALVGAGARRLVGWPDAGGQVTDPVPCPAGRHQLAVQDYLDFLGAAGVAAPFAPPRLTAAPATRARGRAWLAGAGLADGEAVLAFGVGGGNARKRWPLPRFRELGAVLAGHGRALYFVGPREAELVAELAAAPGRDLVADSLPLDLAKGVLAHARLAVCNDHSIMHLAAALQVPTVGVFLASDPDEWFPYPPPARRVVGPPLTCRPCYREDCDDWRCDDPGLPAAVRRAVAELLGA